MDCTARAEYVRPEGEALLGKRGGNFAKGAAVIQLAGR